MLHFSILRLPFVFMALVLLLTPAWASSGTQKSEEAKNLALKAAAYMREVGDEKALADFNSPNPQNPWKDGELYVVVLDKDGVCLVNSNTIAMKGHSVRDTRDNEGKYFIREMMKIQDTGWVNYHWAHPVERVVQEKKAFVIRQGNYLVFVGSYKPLRD